jgi:hypothetical protein
MFNMMAHKLLRNTTFELMNSFSGKLKNPPLLKKQSGRWRQDNSKPVKRLTLK